MVDYSHSLPVVCTYTIMFGKGSSESYALCYNHFLQIPESILRTVVTMTMIIPQPVDHKRFSKFVSKIIINFYVNIVL